MKKKWKFFTTIHGFRVENPNCVDSVECVRERKSQLYSSKDQNKQDKNHFKEMGAHQTDGTLIPLPELCLALAFEFPMRVSVNRPVLPVLPEGCVACRHGRGMSG